MNSKKKILITGASGAVGQEVLRHLLAVPNLYEITAFDLPGKKSNRILSKYKDRILTIYGDITKESTVKNACAGQDVVIHLAAIIPPLADDNPQLCYHVNIKGTRNVIKAMERYAPNAHLIYSSSVSVYGDRLESPWITVGDELIPSIGDEYAETKIECEEAITNSKLSWSIFRLSAIFGYGNHKMSKAMFHMPLSTSIEFATPSDAGRAFANAVEKRELIKNRIFNLGGGENCRVSYSYFLSKSFEIYGLGKTNFPEYAFATKNFHCGYYKDGNDLEEILNFRQDSLESYFNTLRKSIPKVQKLSTQLVKGIIKRFVILRMSEPRKAVRNEDKALIERFFELESLIFNKERNVALSTT